MAKAENLQVRITVDMKRMLRLHQQNLLLEATQDIENPVEKNIEMIRLSKQATYSIGKIARDFLQAGLDDKLVHELETVGS